MSPEHLQALEASSGKKNVVNADWLAHVRACLLPTDECPSCKWWYVVFHPPDPCVYTSLSAEETIEIAIAQTKEALDAFEKWWTTQSNFTALALQNKNTMPAYREMAKLAWDMAWRTAKATLPMRARQAGVFLRAPTEEALETAIKEAKESRDSEAVIFLRPPKDAPKD